MWLALRYWDKERHLQYALLVAVVEKSRQENFTNRINTLFTNCMCEVLVTVLNQATTQTLYAYKARRSSRCPMAVASFQVKNLKSNKVNRSLRCSMTHFKADIKNEVSIIVEGFENYSPVDRTVTEDKAEEFLFS